MPHIEVNGRKIGPGEPVYIIAEMSANHHQDFDEAVRIIRKAKESGADAIKLQTYTPDTMTIPSDNECFKVGKGTLWEGKNLYDLYKEASTPWEWQPKLREIALDIGLELFSTAFDITSLEFLESMNVPVHKIASFELVDIPLIEAAARTGKPMIMSTGMATYEEICDAVNAARSAGASQIALLKCTSAYPAKPKDMNLLTIPNLAETFNVPVGLSDHTLDATVPIAAVALGACIIEKHFTLSREVPGPDSQFSLEPHEFKQMAEAVRTAQEALGEVRYGPKDDELAMRAYRRSLFAVKNIEQGEEFTEENVRSIRPANGLEPKHYRKILGRKAATKIESGTPLNWRLVA